MVLPSDAAAVDHEVSERTEGPVDGYATRSPVAEMLEVSRAAATGEFQLVLDRVVAAAASVIRDAAAASIVLAGRTREQMRLVAGEGLSDRYLQAIASDPSLLQDGAAASAIASGEMVWVEDIRSDPKASRVRQLAIAEGISSFLAVPLKTADTVVGALSVYRTVPGQWMSAEIELLRFFAEYAANAVQTARLIAERQEQVDGLTQLVDALRAQTHEHANRLHALHGLLRLGQTSEAEALLADLLEAHRTTTCEVNRSIRVPSLAGLLVAMMGSAAQRGIVLDIDPDSSLDELPATVTAAQLITVVGNLLENAFDAVAELPEVRRNVLLLVAPDDRHLRIEVLDHGEGLTADLDELRVRGVTTKRGHGGCGLDAVWGVVENAMGTIHVASDDGGAQFVVLIPLASSPTEANA
jgi:signal transduction histidine kinase